MIETLKRSLASWAPGDPPAVSWFLPELRRLLRAEFAGAYRPVARERGWSLDFMYGSGDTAATSVENFRRYVARLPATESFLGGGNPHLVPASQRNRVIPLGELERLVDLDEPRRSLFTSLGILGHDQLRVLICDGPTQLSWIGATREEAFTEREIALLRKLTTPLRRRLRLERQLAIGPLPLLFEAALEALGTAAIVVGPGSTIAMANSAGLALLDRDRRALLHSIAVSKQGEPNAGGFSITHVRARGWPTYTLAISRAPAGLYERVLAAQARWGLTLRQARVLELVATGVSNKEIADALGCAEVTVENHLTALFRRSGARSRAGLVGRLLA